MLFRQPAVRDPWLRAGPAARSYLTRAAKPSSAMSICSRKPSCLISCTQPSTPSPLT